MDFAPLVEKRREHFASLEERLAAPGFYDDPQVASEVMREHARGKRLLEQWADFEDVRRQLEENRELARGEEEELAAMAEEEIPFLEKRFAQLEMEVQYALLPRDPAEDRDAIVEIRAGAGGDEASLFAGELHRMYARYGENRGWKVELLEKSPSEVGGFKEVVFRVAGEDVFRFLKYESGVHRVQRVPATETQGRIHTSTASVAVLPEAEEVDVEIKPDDLRIEVCRAGGAGGQHVNRTESAVQVFHEPSGIMVRCEQERSQIQNRERALKILRAKLFEAKQREEAEKYSAHRKALIGSGDRSEKVRTYNFPQGRVTDHRIGKTVHHIEAFVGGEIDDLIQALQAEDMQARMEEAAATFVA
ncbi:MAG: peptide chain release factor 1 [Verrucomicrobiota bacterium]